MNKKTIGFVGLGLMGSAMVKNLLKDGYPVIGYDIDSNKMAEIVATGADVIQDIEKLPTQTDMIFLSLPNSHVVDDVVNNALSLFETGSKGLVLIDTTTADPMKSEQLAGKLREKGIEMLDATISGTSKMCAEKDITFMVGGLQGVFEDCRQIFSVLGKKTYYLGKNGSGALMKLIVNLVLGLNRFVLAEGLALGKKAGMDPYQLLDVLKNSAAYSKAIDMKGLKMIEKDFEPPEGKLAFHLKDVRLILDLGKRLNFPLLLSSLHAQALASLVVKERSEWDNAAIISFYNDLINT
jgi:2-hydroxy-3-oxopropionate reductase